MGGAVSGATGNKFRQEFALPDVESRRGFDILDEGFAGLGTGQQVQLVFRAEQGVADPTVTREMSAFFDSVADLPDVSRVVSPYSPESRGEQISTTGEYAGKVAFATVELPEDVEFEEGQDIGKAIKAEIPKVDGLEVEVGGAILAEFEQPSSEVLGLAFAIAILIISFGSVLAMGLPVGVALFGIGVGSVFVVLLSHVLTIPDFATALGVMIGLGAGIDYALFIVTRYREQLSVGHTVAESVAIAIDTAGRAVVFAGTTVVISLMGLLLMGVSFVQGLAFGAAAVVACTVAASVTLLPALLGLAGHRVETTRWRGLIAAGCVALALIGIALDIVPLAAGLGVAAVATLVLGSFFAPLRREVPARPRPELRRTTSYRWSRFVQRRPWTSVVAGASLLVVLALPVFGLRLGFSDEGNFAKDTTTRKAYDLVADGFGPGYNGPFILASELPQGADPAALDQITRAIEDDRGVTRVSPPFGNGPDPSDSLAGADAVLWNVTPKTSPQDAATTDLVNRLRDDVLPPVEEAAGVDIAVTGSVGVLVDFSDYLAARLPLFFGGVLTLSFLLLMTVFRSLLVPLKAVVMNLISIGAAYGVVVALFQWGWLSDLTGVQPAPIEPFIPMMLFAIVFGLSMDYEVFLLSRVREEWKRTGDSHSSVADGLAATAKVITAAALIMVFVFGSFILENNRITKLMGVGLASAIFLDATVVRMLLVPATMELLGGANWWLPRWLDRILPNVDVEGHADPVDEDPDDEREPVLSGMR